MRKMNLLLLIGCLTVGVSFFGCEKDKNEGSDNDAGADDAGSGGGDAAQDQDSGQQTDGDGSAGAGACTSTTDQAAIARTDYGESNNQDVSAVAQGCGIGCVTLGGDVAACVAGCLQEAVTDASAACLDCFVDTLMCSSANCQGVCLANPEGNECTACRCGDNDAEQDCVGEWSTCAGLPSLTACPE